MEENWKLCTSIMLQLCPDCKLLYDKIILLGKHLLYSQVMLAIYFHADFLLGLFFDPEDGGVPPKSRLTFNGLYGVISQKI
jgi:hypothetical protein